MEFKVLSKASAASPAARRGVSQGAQGRSGVAFGSAAKTKALLATNNSVTPVTKSIEIHSGKEHSLRRKRSSDAVYIQQRQRMFWPSAIYGCDIIREEKLMKKQKGRVEMAQNV